VNSPAGMRAISGQPSQSVKVSAAVDDALLPDSLHPASMPARQAAVAILIAPRIILTRHAQ